MSITGRAMDKLAARPVASAEERWWYQPPLDYRIIEGIEALQPRTGRMMAQVDRWPAPKVAEAIARGLLHDGWPWELTRRGKAVFGSSGRT